MCGLPGADPKILLEGLVYLWSVKHMARGIFAYSYNVLAFGFNGKKAIECGNPIYLAQWDVEVVCNPNEDIV